MQSGKRGEIEIHWTMPRVALVVCASVWLFYAILAVWLTLVPTGRGVTNVAGGALGNDFLFFFSASKMLLAGEPLAVFDQERLFALQEAIAGQLVVQRRRASTPAATKPLTASESEALGRLLGPDDARNPR